MKTVHPDVAKYQRDADRVHRERGVTYYPLCDLRTPSLAVSVRAAAQGYGPAEERVKALTEATDWAVVSPCTGFDNRRSIHGRYATLRQALAAAKGGGVVVAADGEWADAEWIWGDVALLLVLADGRTARLPA
jgi:hypothetical protein